MSIDRKNFEDAHLVKQLSLISMPLFGGHFIGFQIDFSFIEVS
jgi:hypothetical protein